jgi:phage terminase large subunit-like protein
VPEKALEDNEMYRKFVAGGSIIATPGSMTDFAYIEEEIKSICSREAVQDVCVDDWQANYLITRLADQGLPVCEFNQTVRNMSEPMKELDAMIRSRRITHNADPILSWAISNVTAKEDKKENVFPNKEDNRSKIDPVVAALFAIGRAMTRPEEAVLAHGISFG